MKAPETYQAVWKKYLPVIAMKMQQVVENNKSSHIGMYPLEFRVGDNTGNVGHQFDLEMKEGRLINNISESPAAKELIIILKGDKMIRSMLNEGHFSFSLDGQFIFTIQKKD